MIREISMNRFGLFVHEIASSQKGVQMLHNLDKLITECDIFPLVFYENYPEMPVFPRFAMLQSREAWLYDAPLIATSIEGTQKILDCPRCSHKIFYIWNIDWLFRQQQSLESLAEIYNNDNLHLVARSSAHAKIIANCWKDPIGIIKDFDYHDIAKIISDLD